MNLISFSGMFQAEKDFKGMLAGIKYDDKTGKIISATHTIVLIYSQMKPSDDYIVEEEDSLLGDQV